MVFTCTGLKTLSIASVRYEILPYILTEKVLVKFAVLMACLFLHTVFVYLNYTNNFLIQVNLSKILIHDFPHLWLSRSPRQLLSFFFYEFFFFFLVLKTRLSIPLLSVLTQRFFFMSVFWSKSLHEKGSDRLLRQIPKRYSNHESKTNWYTAMAKNKNDQKTKNTTWKTNDWGIRTPPETRGVIVKCKWKSSINISLYFCFWKNHDYLKVFHFVLLSYFFYVQYIMMSTWWALLKSELINTTGIITWKTMEESRD